MLEGISIFLLDAYFDVLNDKKENNPFKRLLPGSIGSAKKIEIYTQKLLRPIVSSVVLKERRKKIGREHNFECRPISFMERRGVL